MEEITREEMTFERGSGNVYADLGYADPEEMLAKAALVQQIQETMVARGLSQTAAAKIVGIDQPSLSKLLRGIIRNVTLDRLSLILRRLGRDVFIYVGPESATAEPQSNLPGDVPMGHVEVRSEIVAMPS